MPEEQLLQNATLWKEARLFSAASLQRCLKEGHEATPEKRVSKTFSVLTFLHSFCRLSNRAQLLLLLGLEVGILAILSESHSWF